MNDYMIETENEFHIELAVPGLKKEDFKINLDKNVLSVSAEKKRLRRYSFRGFGQGWRERADNRA